MKLKHLDIVRSSLMILVFINFIDEPHPTWWHRFIRNSFENSTIKNLDQKSPGQPNGFGLVMASSIEWLAYKFVRKAWRKHKKSSKKNQKKNSGDQMSKVTKIITLPIVFKSEPPPPPRPYHPPPRPYPPPPPPKPYQPPPPQPIIIREPAKKPVTKYIYHQYHHHHHHYHIESPMSYGSGVGGEYGGGGGEEYGGGGSSGGGYGKMKMKGYGKESGYGGLGGSGGYGDGDYKK